MLFRTICDVYKLKRQLLNKLVDWKKQSKRKPVLLNFVQNELVAKYASPAYSWEYARSEIEFLFKTDSGAVIPLEVKSGKRTRAKSLDVYVQRYQPEKKIKLIGSTGSVDKQKTLVLPLYYASKIEQMMVDL
jgi:predicted AAA+ superfamily ATPase